MTTKEVKDKQHEVKPAVASPGALRIVEMKQAVISAMSFAKDMLPDAKGIRLEEVEPSSGGWSVVISYAGGVQSTFAALRGEEETRVYKKILIDAKTGLPQSLKVWK